MAVLNISTVMVQGILFEVISVHQSNVFNIGTRLKIKILNMTYRTALCMYTI